MVYLFAVSFAIVGLFSISSATFYSHHRYRGHHRIHLGTRVYTPPQRFFPNHVPPTIIHTRVRIPYIRPPYFRPMPSNILPVGTVYPATGMQIPNPLNEMNTYDLPQWQQSSPIYNNVGQILNMEHVPSPILNNIGGRPSVVNPNVNRVTNTVTQRLPTKEVSVSIPEIKPAPSIPDNTDNKDDDSNDNLTLPPPVVKEDKEKSCNEVGCELGSECVYLDAWICPAHIPDLSCQCQQGCRLQYTFIPLGASTVVDTCGNVCTCNSLYGGVNCTVISCNQKPKSKDSSTSGLLIEPVHIDASDVGPSRGDFPIPGQDHKDEDEIKVTFPNQDIVPPIPFLTERKNNDLFPDISTPLDTELSTDKSPSLGNDLQADAMIFPIAK